MLVSTNGHGLGGNLRPARVLRESSCPLRSAGERESSYEFCRRRRTRPPMPTSPVPTRNRLAGSGVVIVGVQSVPAPPTTSPALLILSEQPVLLTPCRCSQAKELPVAFPVNDNVTEPPTFSPLLIPLSAAAHNWNVARFPIPPQLVRFGSMLQLFPPLALTVPPVMLAYPPMPTAVRIPVLPLGS